MEQDPGDELWGKLYALSAQVAEVMREVSEFSYKYKEMKEERDSLFNRVKELEGTDKMSDFEKRWGNLTVEEALELNKKAEETCAFEMTAV